MVAGAGGVVPLPLPVLLLVAAVPTLVMVALVFLLRGPVVLLVGALVARFVFLDKSNKFYIFVSQK